jgi:phage replication-related protein YjqB (UPF0714/DUF867 family)
VTFAALLAHPGVDEVCVRRGRFGFMAYHGGSLEEMTDVIATAAAEQSDASYYGVHQPPDLQWHIPSIDVTPAASTELAWFLDHVDVVVTVHGYGRQGLWTTLLLGGGNRTLADHVGGHLRAALPAYEIATDLERIPKELRGLHPRNPVNRPAGGGVQLELPPRVRGSSPLWADWDEPGPVPHTVALIEGLAAAARSWPAVTD